MGVLSFQSSSIPMSYSHPSARIWRKSSYSMYLPSGWFQDRITSRMSARSIALRTGFSFWRVSQGSSLFTSALSCRLDDQTASRSIMALWQWSVDAIGSHDADLLVPRNLAEQVGQHDPECHACPPAIHHRRGT